MRLFITAAALAALPFMALADETTDNNVKARQGYFQMLAANMAPLAAMAKGEAAYDEGAAVTAATNIETLTRYTLPSHFVAGSADGDHDASNAKSEIWANSEDFAAKFADLGTAAAGASEAVKGGQANVGPVVQKLGMACKACHDLYRVKD